MIRKLENLAFLLFVLGFFLLLNTNCKKTEDIPLPVLTTLEISNVTQTSAQSGGSITSDGGFPVSAKGVCWSTSKNPTIKGQHTNDGVGTGAYSSQLTGLSIGPLYYIRAYATTEKGTAYGNEITFTNFTGKTGTVSDIDGNTYKTIGIGIQIWMAENLKVTRYTNSHYIDVPGTYYEIWGNLEKGAYAWFDNDASWKNSYGALYNWYAVKDARGLCPEGWHIPGDEEWDQLLNYLELDKQAAGASIKSCRQVNSPIGSDCDTDEHPRWNAHITHHGTDEFMFSALPGGFRHADGHFSTFLGLNGQWWTSTESSLQAEAISRGLSHQSSTLYRDKFNKRFGFSVRCIMDE